MSNFFESSVAFLPEEPEQGEYSESYFMKRKQELIAQIEEKDKITDEKKREKLEIISELATEDAFWDEMDHWFKEHPKAVGLDGFINDTINHEVHNQTKIENSEKVDDKGKNEKENTEPADDDEDDALLSEINKQRGS